MPAQWRLPARPRGRALQSSMLLRSGAWGAWVPPGFIEEHGLLEEIFLRRRDPLHPDFPLAPAQGTDVEALFSLFRQSQRNRQVNRGVGGPVKLDAPSGLRWKSGAG